MSASHQDDVFELTEEVQQAIHRMFERIPFNQVVGLKLGELSKERVTLNLPMKPELIGNFMQGILHGGVIATVLDVAGGAMALIAAAERYHGLPVAERLSRLAKLGTIDLRIDYLTPGRGEHFVAQAVTLRSGKKIAVIRTELHGADGTLVAVGTGTYLCG